MQYGSWFKGFTPESLTKLMLEHPDLAKKLEIDLINRDILNKSKKQLEEQVDKKYQEKEKLIHNEYQNKLIQEIEKVKNEGLYKHIFTENYDESQYDLIKSAINKNEFDKKIEQYINNINVVSDRDKLSQVFATLCNIRNKKLKDISELKEVETYSVFDKKIQEQLNSSDFIKLINNFSKEINLHDWRKFATLEQKELETLINLKVISEEFLEIKDSFLSEDITEQLKLYTNLDQAESIIIGCDHRHVQVKYNSDIPSMKTISGGCYYYNETQPPHPNDSANVYVTHWGNQYNIFMNIFDLEKLKILLTKLPNVKKIYDHTQEILDCDNPLEKKSLDDYHCYTKSTHEYAWQGRLDGSDAVKHFLDWIEIFSSKDIEIYKRNKEWSSMEQDITQLQEQYENFILGEALPNYIE